MKININFSFLGALALLFIGLKLTGYITWSWWWVTLPLWAVPAIFVAIGILFIMLGMVAGEGLKNPHAPRKRK